MLHCVAHDPVDLRMISKDARSSATWQPAWRASSTDRSSRPGLYRQYADRKAHCTPSKLSGRSSEASSLGQPSKQVR